MKLSEAQLKEFQELYLKHFNVNLSKKDAHNKGLRLVNLLRAVYEPKLKEK